MSKPRTTTPNGSPDDAPPPPVATVTRQTLEETPGRVLPFLRAIGTTPTIFALMAARGYGREDHAEGWDLLHAVSGYVEGGPAPAVDTRVRDAMATIDNEDEDVFRIVESIRRLHPEQATFLLDGLGPSTGTESVVGMKQLLTRFDKLEKGEERKATRKADHEALKTLAKRGLGAKERARYAELCAIAESVGDAPPADDGRAERDQKLSAALVALRAWYEEWTAVARVAVKRRDYLIRMGMAKRKAAGKAGRGEGKARDATSTPA